MKTYRLYPKVEKFSEKTEEDKYLRAFIQEKTKNALLGIDMGTCSYEYLPEEEKEKIQKDLVELALKIVSNPHIWMRALCSEKEYVLSKLKDTGDVGIIFRFNGAYECHVHKSWIGISAEKEVLWQYAEDVRRFCDKWYPVLHSVEVPPDSPCLEGFEF